MTGAERRKVWNEAIDAAVRALHDYVGLSEDEKRIAITAVVRVRTDSDTTAETH